jgi:hypothetical protein
MKAHIKAHFTTNENIMIKLHIKVVIHDAATTLWRQHSPSYDNNRAVQIPSTEPGHTVRRKRKSSETEYQYRNRIPIQKETGLCRRYLNCSIVVITG